MVVAEVLGNMENTMTADVVVIGGGPAGLTAAVALSRFGRRIVVIDAGEPRNARAEGMHNVLGLDGMAPTEYLARGRAELARFGGSVLADSAVSARPDEAGFVVRTASSGDVAARRLLVASGSTDELPAVPGLAELWGRDIVHCPFCHGWEVRGRRLGVLGTGPASAHQAAMFAELTDDIVYFAHSPAGWAELPAGIAHRLCAIGVQVVESPVARLVAENGRLAAAVSADGMTHPLAALVVAPEPSVRSPVLDDLGVPRAEKPFGYVADPMGATAVPGVWIAGNVANVNAPVVLAAASGMTAAAAITADIITTRAEAALASKGTAIPEPATP